MVAAAIVRNPQRRIPNSEIANGARLKYGNYCLTSEVNNDYPNYDWLQTVSHESYDMHQLLPIQFALDLLHLEVLQEVSRAYTTYRLNGIGHTHSTPSFSLNTKSGPKKPVFGPQEYLSTYKIPFPHPNVFHLVSARV